MRIERPRATLTVATVNDDFTTPLRSHAQHMRKKADVVLYQEGKTHDYRKLLRNEDRFGVHQNFKDEGKAGAAISWDKREVTAKNRGYRFGVDNRGEKMLDRWINFVDMKVDGRMVRVATVHRPPQRFANLWKFFDQNLQRFAKSSPHPLIIGMDANQQNPKRMAAMAGMKWVAPKGSIDGFLVSPGIRVERKENGERKLWTLPEGSSKGHHPTVAKFVITPSATRPGR